MIIIDRLRFDNKLQELRDNFTRTPKPDVIEIMEWVVSEAKTIFTGYLIDEDKLSGKIYELSNERVKFDAFDEYLECVSCTEKITMLEMILYDMSEEVKSESSKIERHIIPVQADMDFNDEDWPMG